MANNQAPINVYIILGEQNMRKSSTMRCLTGAFQQGIFEIEHCSGNIRRTFIKFASLQEAGYDEKKFEVLVNQKLVDKNEKKQFEDVFISLRINGFTTKSGKKLNDGYKYIIHFKSIGWNIIEIVDFQKKSNIIPLGNITPTLTVTGTDTDPSNKTASTVRNQFKWK